MPGRSTETSHRTRQEEHAGEEDVAGEAGEEDDTGRPIPVPGAYGQGLWP